MWIAGYRNWLAACGLLLVTALAGVAVAEERGGSKQAGDSAVWLQMLSMQASMAPEFRSVSRVIVNTTEPNSGTLASSHYVVRADRARQRYAVYVPGAYHVYVEGRTLTMVAEMVQGHYMQVELDEPPTFASVLEHVAPAATAFTLLSVDFALLLDEHLDGLLPGVTASDWTQRHRGFIQGVEPEGRSFTFQFGEDRAGFGSQAEDGAIWTVFEAHPAWVRQRESEHRLFVSHGRLAMSEPELRRRTEGLFTVDIEGREATDPQTFARLTREVLNRGIAQALRNIGPQEVAAVHENAVAAHRSAEQALARLGETPVEQRDRLYLGIQRHDTKSAEAIIAAQRGVASRLGEGD